MLETDIVYSPSPDRYFLVDLRDQYSRAIFQVANGTAEKYVPLITQWMRENAPWNDVDVYVGGELKYKAGNARKYLKAWINRYSPEQKKFFEAKERQAQQVDKETLEYLNKDRYSKGQIPLSKLPTRKMQPRDWMPSSAPIVSLTAGHSNADRVPYGIWLELAHNGRYSIVRPTVDYWGPKLFKSIQILINRGLISAGDTWQGGPGDAGMQGPGGRRVRTPLERRRRITIRRRGRRRTRTRRTFDRNQLYY